MSSELDAVAAREWDLDVAELGERAAWWMLRDEFGALYGSVKDRARAVAAGCYAKCAESLGAENVPPQWRPSFDEHGMWRMP